ncbi:MAG: hypothetical protein OEW18_12070 [Candidatus Aminicenantes bacterium]|nr:hypothetical protein [Candidatus Aminicenantes bacterium]
MKRKKMVCVGILLGIPLVGVSEIHLPGDGFFPGWKKAGPGRIFVRTDLFNYIDGGADLFLEFGFEKLAVQRYARGPAELVLEIYRMQNPEAALGIYLMKRGGAESAVEPFELSHSDKYQRLLLQGNCLVSVNNPDGSEALLPTMDALAVGTLASIPKQEAKDFFAMLPGEKRLAGTERLIRGRVGLQSIYTFGEGDILLLRGRIFGVAADYRDDEGGTYARLAIPYPDDVSAREAWRNFRKEHDPYIRILASSEGAVTFSDFRGKFGVVEIKGRRLDIRVNLAKAPSFSTFEFVSGEKSR